MQLFANVLCETVHYFGMTGNRRRISIKSVDIHTVPRTLAVENTAVFR